MRGAFGMASHCMAGGWRAVYDAADPPIDTMLVDVAWDDPCARLPAFVAGCGGRILSPTASTGTFADLLGRPPSDRLGPTPFGEGASSSRPRRAAVLDGAPAPVNDIGVYTVLLYPTLLDDDAAAAAAAAGAQGNP